MASLYLTETDFEWYGEEVGWKTDVIYKDETSKPTTYFYSPDGIGRVWLDTLQEMFDNVFLPNTPVVSVKLKKG